MQLIGSYRHCSGCTSKHATARNSLLSNLTGYISQKGPPEAQSKRRPSTFHGGPSARPAHFGYYCPVYIAAAREKEWLTW